MSKLNAKQVEAVGPVLQRFQTNLEQSGAIDHQAFDRGVRQAIGSDHPDIKEFAQAIAKLPNGKYPALYWMQHNNAPGPQSEFKGNLAAAYGIKSYDEHDGRELAEEFWKTFPTHRGNLTAEV